MFRDKLQYAFYTMIHPVDGFYEIRHRNRGSVLLAILLVFLFGICFSANRQYAGFVVNSINPMSVNSFAEILSVMILFFLFCIGNWSVTCLMEGEGRLKDIVITTGYSVLPMILTFIPAIILSVFLVEEESGYYTLIIGFGIVWFLLLALSGIMTIHNFTLLKTLVTVVCTFAAMLIIIFVTILLYALASQVISSFTSMYDELMLRI